MPKIAISEGIANLFGIPGAGLTASIVSSMNAGKNEAIKQADALISSPIFIRNAKLGTPDAMREIAESTPFVKFAKTVGLQQDINSKIQFLTNSAQNLKNIGESNDNTN